MLMQHYHTSTNLSRKLDASLRYLQLQLGTPHNPFLLDYAVWGHLAPLSWVKMLWQTLHYFNIHLYMAYPSIALPRERDQVLMEIFQSMDLSQETILSLNRCRVSLESIFLSDITTADGHYLEDFVFSPGGRDRSSSFCFPREVPMKANWNRWFDFGTPSQQLATNSRSPLATGSTPHTAFGNGFTGKGPMTYYG